LYLSVSVSFPFFDITTPNTFCWRNLCTKQMFCFDFFWRIGSKKIMKLNKEEKQKLLNSLFYCSKSRRSLYKWRHEYFKIPAVNFINVFSVLFSYECRFCSFVLCTYFCTYVEKKLPKWHLYEKSARKMLMKLTPRFHLYLMPHFLKCLKHMACRPVVLNIPQVTGLPER